jgi:hypothetical protein
VGRIGLRFPKSGCAQRQGHPKDEIGVGVNFERRNVYISIKGYHAVGSGKFEPDRTRYARRSLVDDIVK